MTKSFSAVVSGLVLAVSMAAPLQGQSSAPPETYSFLSTNAMVGPEMIVKVNRNGSRELIERTAIPKAGSPSEFHDRVLYDFQAHRIYSVDLNSHICTAQAYTSAYAPVQLDPIGGVTEMQSKMATNPPKPLAVESVNGIRAKAVESASDDLRAKVWLEDRFNFAVKEVFFRGSGPGTTVFEMQQLSYAPSPAVLFAAPSGCTQIGGAANASGGSAEMTVEVQPPAQTHQLGGGNVRAEKQPGAAGVPDQLMGKWDFTGEDNAGVAWRGTLTIGELDPSRFDPNPAKYNHMCAFELESAGAGKGRENACLFDGSTRALSLSGGSSSNKYSYTATLSPDGKSLAQGRWTEGNSVTGTWSARLSGADAGAPPASGIAGEAPSAASIAAGSNPQAKLTAVNLQAAEVPYNGACGKKLQVSGTFTTGGPAAVWYRVYSNVGGVEFSDGQTGIVNVDSAGATTIKKDATFSMDKKGELRIQAAVQNADGRHGAVTISNVVQFQATCRRRTARFSQDRHIGNLPPAILRSGSFSGKPTSRPPTALAPSFSPDFSQPTQYRSADLPVGCPVGLPAHRAFARPSIVGSCADCEKCRLVRQGPIRDRRGSVV